MSSTDRQSLALDAAEQYLAEHPGCTPTEMYRDLFPESPHPFTLDDLAAATNQALVSGHFRMDRDGTLASGSSEGGDQ